ncbi:MAG: hypothetical protein B7Z83_12445, partial [Thiomonas sp. 20-64-5]
NNVVGPVDFLTAGATALAYGAVGYLVPGIAGSMMNGSPAMSLSNAGAAAGGMAVAPIAAGLAGGAAGMRGASALAGLLPDSRSGGAKGGIGGSAMLGGGPVGGVSGTSRLESLASGAGKGLQTAGQGVSAAGSAAGTGIKAASGAANVIPVAGQAIAAVGAAVGTGVEAAGKVAGKGLEATGKAVEGAGKVAGKAAEGAGKAVEGVKSGAELGKADAPATQEAGLSSARTTVGSTPGGNGFASTQSQIGASADASPAANAADASAAQRQFEKDNAPKPKGRSLADTLKSGAQSLQYEANRRKPGLSHDGQSGGVSIRMNHID